ncbi:MAG: amino-acid N-acetyltransferase [Gammaproteobacteria bacterium]|nr:MAG: amino-acid N-acetyltransferase [Gammaproteobacteria bacterium]
MTTTASDQVAWFRQTSPYIHAHRCKTLVVMLDGDVFAGEAYKRIVSDLTLLNSLGLKIVVVFGVRHEVERVLADRSQASHLHHGVRVTDETAMDVVARLAGAWRARLEARFSMALPNSPMHNSAVKVCSGNFVTARPVGVLDGVDLCLTGTVRRVHAEALREQLSLGYIVLIPPTGCSMTGELFNLTVEETASAVAQALEADKLIVYAREPVLCGPDGKGCRELTVGEARTLARSLPVDGEARRKLDAACRALENGVGRVHWIGWSGDGAILEELFTRDGVGTLITDESYEQVRMATIEDVASILELIRPLEEGGVLVRRSRERLEQEISHFVIDERDGAVIGCAALHPLEEEAAELACVAVRSDYAGKGRGERLLSRVERLAREQGIRTLFVLTTQTAHWFLEHGFEPASPESLPVKRQQTYNWQRNSKVFVKRLD